MLNCRQASLSEGIRERFREPFLLSEQISNTDLISLVCEAVYLQGITENNSAISHN